MLHARKDYDRIQDPDNKIPEDEPVFLLRAQDRISDAVVSYWAELNDKYGGDEKMSQMARTQAAKMSLWPNRKLADL